MLIYYYLLIIHYIECRLSRKKEKNECSLLLFFFNVKYDMYLNRRIPYFIQITTFTIRVFIVFLYLPHHSHMLPREHVKLFHGLNTILF